MKSPLEFFTEKYPAILTGTGLAVAVAAGSLAIEKYGLGDSRVESDRAAIQQTARFLQNYPASSQEAGHVLGEQITDSSVTFVCQPGVPSLKISKESSKSRHARIMIRNCLGRNALLDLTVSAIENGQPVTIDTNDAEDRHPFEVLYKDKPGAPTGFSSPGELNLSILSGPHEEQVLSLINKSDAKNVCFLGIANYLGKKKSSPSKVCFP